MTEAIRRISLRTSVRGIALDLFVDGDHIRSTLWKRKRDAASVMLSFAWGRKELQRVRCAPYYGSHTLWIGDISYDLPPAELQKAARFFGVELPTPADDTSDRGDP